MLYPCMTHRGTVDAPTCIRSNSSLMMQQQYGHLTSTYALLTTEKFLFGEITLRRKTYATWEFLLHCVMPVCDRWTPLGGRGRGGTLLPH